MEPSLGRRDFVALGSSAAVAAGLGLDANGEAKQNPTLKAQRLSWAGIKLELGGRTLLIDPWISPEIWDGAWTMPVTPIQVATRGRSTSRLRSAISPCCRSRRWTDSASGRFPG